MVEILLITLIVAAFDLLMKTQQQNHNLLSSDIHRPCLN